MPNMITIMILTIFTLQIFIVSFYYVRLRMKHKIASIRGMGDKEQKLELIKQRKTNNNILLVLGLLIIVISLLLPLSQRLLLMLILSYSSLQLIQYVLDKKWYATHISSQLKADNSHSRKRSTNFQARRLRDFISPLLFTVAVLSYILALVVSIYLLSHEILGNKTIKIYLLLLLNSIMFAYYFWQIYQAIYAKPKVFGLEYSLRLAQIKKKVINILYALIVYNVFILTLLAFKASQLGIASVIILTSLFFQAVLFPRNINYET